MSRSTFASAAASHGPALRAVSARPCCQGLAPDGGLYVPDSWPQLDAAAVRRRAARWRRSPRRCSRPSSQAMRSRRCCRRSPPRRSTFRRRSCRSMPTGGLRVLELFHGPTAAFKDFGARFLAACFARLRGRGERGRSPSSWPPPETPVVPSRRPSTAGPASRWRCCFPRGWCPRPRSASSPAGAATSARFAVRGTFDDCQRLVKQAFRRSAAAARSELSSANSINLGRLLPQAVYYAATSLAVWREYGEPASFIIPSGNLGNAMACLWARKHRAADRRNRAGAQRQPHRAGLPATAATGGRAPSVATLASAMDVGDPSNMERLRALFPELARTARGRERRTASAMSEIRARIRAGFQTFGQIWCPHTATAAEACTRLSAGASAGAPLGDRVDRARGEVSARSSSRSSGARCRCPRRWRSCSRARRNAPRSTPTWLRCARRCRRRASGRAAETAADRLGADRRRRGARASRPSWLWRWYRQYRDAQGAARRGDRRRAPITSSTCWCRTAWAAGFHVDFLLLTRAAFWSSTCATCRATSSAATRWPSGP